MKRGVLAMAVMAFSLPIPPGARAQSCARVATIPLPAPCAAGGYGLAFDGEILYYSLRDDPEPGRVRKVRPATGVDEGSFLVTSAGQPLGPLAGLAWDPGRAMLWVAAGDTIHLVRPSDGEVVRSRGRDGTYAGLSYDVVYDVLYDLDYATVNPVLRCYPVDGSGCRGEPVLDGSSGLTFDGRDLWSFTQYPLPPEYPDFGPRFYPVDHGNFGTAPWRICDTPLTLLDLFDDLAYDCVTFAVPVVWGTVYQQCRLDANPVEPGTPCPNSPDYLAAFRLRQATRAALVPRLPVTGPGADEAFQVSRPLSHRFVLEARGSFWPLAAYRLLGPGDADRGNVLRVVRDGEDIVAGE
jgi:hypothetical protein